MGLNRSDVEVCTPIMKAVICADGYVLRYRVWTPVDSTRAVIVLLNGVMSHSRWFEPLVPLLLQAGVKLVGADRRGTGVNAEGRGDAPSAKALIDDLKDVIEAEALDDTPLHLAGWCWGSVLAINVAAELEDRLDGLVLMAPGLYPTEPLTNRMKLQEGLVKTQPLSMPCLASPIAEDMFTTGPYLENFILKDTQRTTHFTPRFYSIMTRMGTGARIRLKQLHLPILLVIAESDQATDNNQTIRAFGTLTAPVTLAIVPGAHGIQFDAPGVLAQHLLSWIGPEHCRSPFSSTRSIDAHQ